MGKKAIITIDLTTIVGTMKLQMPAHSLPRHSKAELELTIARMLVRALQSQSRDSFTGLRSNANDPPDVLLEHNGVTTGIELTELLPPNRLEKDAIICSLRERILSKLNIGERTRNCVVHIFLTDDYCDKLRPKRCNESLARLFNDFFNNPRADRRELTVPSNLRDTVSHILVDTEDLSGDPRLSNENQPLIIFGAQNTMIVPDDDVPKMLDAALQPKLRHDLSMPTWLLVWSNHPAIASVRNELIEQMRSYLVTKMFKYRRVFYLDIQLPPVLERIH